jgi:hypothetical protein
MFQRFEDENSGAFARDHALAISVKRSAGIGSNGSKSSKPRVRYSRKTIRPAGEHYRGAARQYRVKTKRDRVIARRARCGNRNVRSVQAELGRDVSGDYIAGIFADEFRMHPLELFRHVTVIVLFDHMRLSGGRTNRDARLILIQGALPLRIGQGDSGSGYSKLGGSAHCVGVLNVNISPRSEAFDFGTAMAGIIRSVKGSHLVYTGPAFEQAIPELLRADTYWCNQANASHDHR